MIRIIYKFKKLPQNNKEDDHCVTDFLDPQTVTSLTKLRNIVFLTDRRVYIGY